MVHSGLFIVRLGLASANHIALAALQPRTPATIKGTLQRLAAGNHLLRDGRAFFKLGCSYEKGNCASLTGSGVCRHLSRPRTCTGSLTPQGG